MVSPATLVALALSVAPMLVASAGILKRTGCDISHAEISNLPAGLPNPTTPPSYVAIAIGTQNYTCNSTAGTYTNVGAVAELFDISCLYKTRFFASLPDFAIEAWSAAPSSVTTQEVISALGMISSSEVLGQHYYVTNPINGQGIEPKWDFTSHLGNPDDYVVASKVDSANAPTGSQDIAWVYLTRLTGNLAQQVYRTDTRLGQPPASCQPGSAPIDVKYAAKYWLY